MNASMRSLYRLQWCRLFLSLLRCGGSASSDSAHPASATNVTRCAYSLIASNPLTRPDGHRVDHREKRLNVAGFTLVET